MCVIQVRQPDVTIVNMTMSVMHQVLEKHQFMPDVIAMVGEGVLTKNRYGEKQRGKMLSLFMSAKMYVRHSLLLFFSSFLWSRHVENRKLTLHSIAHVLPFFSFCV